MSESWTRTKKERSRREAKCRQECLLDFSCNGTLQRMGKRLWFALSMLWAVVFIGNGLTKVDGIQTGDVLLTMAPLIAGQVLIAVALWVVRG
jgi:hypothetical protein